MLIWRCHLCCFSHCSASSPCHHVQQPFLNSWLKKKQNVFCTVLGTHNSMYHTMHVSFRQKCTRTTSWRSLTNSGIIGLTSVAILVYWHRQNKIKRIFVFRQLVGSVLLILLVCWCCHLKLCVVCSKFLVVMSATIYAQKRCLVRLYLQLFVGRPMFYLRYLCLLAYNVVQHIGLCILLVCLRPDYLLPVSLDDLYLIATSVFSDVY